MRRLMKEEELCREEFDDRCTDCTAIAVPAGKGTVNRYEIFDSLYIYFYKVREVVLSKLVRKQKNCAYLHYCYSGSGIMHHRQKGRVEISPGDYMFEHPSQEYMTRMEVQDEYVGVTVECDTEKLNRYFSDFFADEEFECCMGEPYISKEGKILLKKAENIVLRALEEFCKDYKQSNLKVLKVKIADLLCQLYEIHRLHRLEGGYVPKYKIKQMDLVRKYLEDHLENQITLDEIAQEYQMSVSTLKTSFKTVYGIPVYTYLKMIRMEAAEKMLLNTDQSVTEIANKVGYSNASKFAEAFREQYGICPSAIRKISQGNHLP